MSANTTQPRFNWCVVEIPDDNGSVRYDVQRKRQFQGRLPGGMRIVGRADDERIAQIFVEALRRQR